MVNAPGSPQRAAGLTRAGAVVFAVSTAFPVIASVLPADSAPGWVGIADVAIAIVLVALAFIVMARAPSGFSADVVGSSFAAYRAACNLLLALLAVFLVWGDALRWNVLLPGLAWRAWLFVTVLPSFLTLWQERRP